MYFLCTKMCGCMYVFEIRRNTKDLAKNESICHLLHEGNCCRFYGNYNDHRLFVFLHLLLVASCLQVVEMLTEKNGGVAANGREDSGGCNIVNQKMGCLLPEFKYSDLLIENGLFENSLIAKKVVFYLKCLYFPLLQRKVNIEMSFQMQMKLD